MLEEAKIRTVASFEEPEANPEEVLRANVRRLELEQRERSGGARVKRRRHK